MTDMGLSPAYARRLSVTAGTCGSTNCNDPAFFGGVHGGAEVAGSGVAEQVGAKAAESCGLSFAANTRGRVFCGYSGPCRTPISRSTRW